MSEVAGAISVLGAVLQLAAGCCALLHRANRRARRSSNDSNSTAVSILKPLSGSEARLEECLQSFCRLDFRDYEILFGVARDDETALEIARHAVADAAPPHLSASFVVASPDAPNAKVSMLLELAKSARNSVLLWADSDIKVATDHLAAVVATLFAPSVGAVTCPYVGEPQGGLWSRLGAMWINFHFMPLAIFSKTAGLAHPCFGSTIAMRRDVLEAVGGFASFGSTLADDFKMGEAVRRLGLKVELAPVFATTIVSDATIGVLWRRELRWQTTVRTIAGPGHYASIVSHPIPIALVALALAGSAAWAWVLLLIVFGVRYLSAALSARAFALRPPPPLLLLLRDALSFGVFIRSLAASRIEWRGRTLKVDRAGMLSPQ
jgi:ceramide glucosyltransferase